LISFYEFLAKLKQLNDNDSARKKMESDLKQQRKQAKG
jgi:hypothetical protein